MYNVEEAAKAQRDYCKTTNNPLFAPFTGTCYKCRKNIYSEGGYSVESASKGVITGCPFCNKSYCD